jgi:IS30 family transposase
MGVELGRSHTTILRELHRNGEALKEGVDYYQQAELAQAATHERRVLGSRRKMRLKSREIRHYVELHLVEAQWSVGAISGRLTTLGYPISHEAIYQWIHYERPELKSNLPVAGKFRRRRICGKKHRRAARPVAAAPKRSIEERSEEAEARRTIGHFEMDAMCGQKGGAAVQNKVDRKSRKMFLDLVGSLTSEEYATKCIERLGKAIRPGVLKTLTLDNGSEHAEHLRMEKELGALVHFCHPHCASERGTVENRNRALRRFLPKGACLNDLPHEYLEWIEDYFNNMPMKVLDFKTPNEVWREELAKVA